MATYPRIVTDYRGNHVAILATLAEGADPIRCCGESWCAGKCGMPALCVPASDGWPNCKVYSDVVACGMAVQPWRVTWTGNRVDVSEEQRAALRKKWWL